MNVLASGFPFSLLMILPLLFWVVIIYLILRLLRAVEAGARAQDRIAEALERGAVEGANRMSASSGL